MTELNHKSVQGFFSLPGDADVTLIPAFRVHRFGIGMTSSVSTVSTGYSTNPPHLFSSVDFHTAVVWEQN